ncbi:hypothetical protein [Phytoactinopolyspora limicola]|uniref:hypothetical protein n=1 Tax=Phytoactinopolyspora limicola TaxID=2715536 RepID=UPI00140906EA|nr:hypothetical protein [Phytoactinopolyspora limicola]
MSTRTNDQQNQVTVPTVTRDGVEFIDDDFAVQAAERAAERWSDLLDRLAR